MVMYHKCYTNNGYVLSTEVMIHSIMGRYWEVTIVSFMWGSQSMAKSVNITPRIKADGTCSDSYILLPTCNGGGVGLTVNTWL